jgi:hypothetical protein
MPEQKKVSLVGADAKEGKKCRECGKGKYHEVKSPMVAVTTRVFQFRVDNVAGIIKARVVICDYCGHIEFFRARDMPDNPNA